jgi:succinyl-diaminopimelate desuccinylase
MVDGGFDAVTNSEMAGIAELLQRLIAIDSRNPDLTEGAPGELEIANFVAGKLNGFGLEVTFAQVIGERSNVIGTLPGHDSAATVIFEAHLDTVPASPATMKPLQEGGRIYGRGACDTKGSLAAMIAAVERLAAYPGRRPTVILAAACDEEYRMRGARQLAKTLPSADAVIIGEPTRLIPARMHNGFMRFAITVRGIAAHSSRAELGTNAIVHAARLVLELDAVVGERLRTEVHPLAGAALLSATVVEGGTAPNVIPDRCTVWFDRRVGPDESCSEALAEIRAVVAGYAKREDVVIDVGDPVVAFEALKTGENSLVVLAAQSAAEEILKQKVVVGGMTYSTDACCFSDRADLPSVVLGPGSIEQAHGDLEWVEVAELLKARDIYFELALRIAELVQTGAKGDS